MQGERSIRLSGIVILVRDYKDSDRTVVLFTRERGLFSFVAKGVRKLTSHNRSSTDLFIQGEYELKRSKAYYILSQGKVENSFPGIHRGRECGHLISRSCGGCSRWRIRSEIPPGFW